MLEPKDLGNPRELPALTLAYIGDVVYELEVRNYILEKGLRKVDDLHKEAIKYVCAKTQADIAHLIMEELTEEEMAILKRGRNTKGHLAPKNSNPATYRLATGMEALVGFWYLSKNEARLNWFFSILWTLEV